MYLSLSCIPRNLCSSFTLVGEGKLAIRSTISFNGFRPCPEMPCPRNCPSGYPKRHFSRLSCILAPWKHFSATLRSFRWPSKLSECVIQSSTYDSVLQCYVQDSLEGALTVAQTEWHHQHFIVASRNCKSGFFHVLFP